MLYKRTGASVAELNGGGDAEDDCDYGLCDLVDACDDLIVEGDGERCELDFVDFH